MGTRRRANRLSLIARATRALVGKPEKPKPPAWPDILGAVLLFTLGASAAICGLVFHRALGSHALLFETMALTTVVGGMASLRGGVVAALGVVWPRAAFSEDEEAYATIYVGLPFILFGLACGMLAALLPEPAAAVAAAMIGVAAASGAVGLIVALWVELARRVRRPRKDGERASRPPSDSDKRP